MPEAWLLAFTLVCEGLMGAGVLVSYVRPDLRIWPPPGAGTWPFWFIWSATIGSTAGVTGLGLMHRARATPLGPRVVAGWSCVLVGLAFAGWGMYALGARNSTGLRDGFVAAGPYRFSRNPQYVGDSLFLLGWILLFPAGSVIVTSGLGILWFLLVPFVEEPWLEEQYGEAYGRYRNHVPRYLGFPST